MPTAKESLRKQVDQLSEQDAQEILGLISARGLRPAAEKAAKVTREVIRQRLADRPAFRVPPADARPFRRRKRIQCPGIPASELLIADRR
jgi:hypothetical protein